MRRILPAAAVAAAIAVACGVAAPRPDGIPEAAAETPEEKAYSDAFVKRFRRAQELFGTGKDEEAAAILRELAAEQPGAAAVHHALAFTELHRGHRDRAIEGFRKAAALAPGDGAIRRDCGLQLVEVGRFADAIPHLEAARKLLDADLETVCALGRALEATGRPGEAEAAFRDARRIDADSVDARALLARHVLATRPEEALALLEGVPLNWPDVVEIRAMTLERLGRWSDASALWKRLAELAQAGAAGVPTLRTAAESLVRCGDFATAAAVAAKWVATDRAGDRPGLRASVCLAVARAGAGETVPAFDALDAAVVPDSAPPAIRAHLGLTRAHLLVRCGRADEARKAVEAVAALDAPFEGAAARYLLGREPFAKVAAAAETDPARANDAAWVAWLGAVLSDDATAAAEHLAKARAATKPPGEHPGALLAGIR